MKIKVGEKLTLKLIDKDGQEVFKGLTRPTIISTFPKLNTGICDNQTMWMGEYANKYKHIDFLSITLDDVDTISKWCLAHSLENIDIVSDRDLKDFTIKTGLTIGAGEARMLRRGFIFIDAETIEGIVYGEKSEEPNYKAAEEWLESK